MAQDTSASASAAECRCCEQMRGARSAYCCAYAREKGAVQTAQQRCERRRYAQCCTREAPRVARQARGSALQACHNARVFKMLRSFDLLLTCHALLLLSHYTTL